MKTLSAFRFYVFVGFFSVSFFALSQAQTAKMSFNSAYSMLNPGSKSTVSNISTVNVNKGSMTAAAINAASYTKKVLISYGIPIAILFEFINVKNNLSSDLASDPDTYNNCADNVQQALVNLAYSDFQKISDYKKVNVKLNFQFNPAKLVIYGSDEGDYLNNGNSSPWDVGVYKAPTTAVSGSKVMVVQK